MCSINCKLSPDEKGLPGMYQDGYRQGPLFAGCRIVAVQAMCTVTAGATDEDPGSGWV